MAVDRKKVLTGGIIAGAVVFILLLLYVFKFYPDKIRALEIENQTLQASLNNPNIIEKPVTKYIKVVEPVYVYVSSGPASASEKDNSPGASRPSRVVKIGERVTETTIVDGGREVTHVIPRVEGAQRVIVYKDKPRLSGLVEYKFSDKIVNGQIQYDIGRFILGASVNSNSDLGIIGGYRIK